MYIWRCLVICDYCISIYWEFLGNLKCALYIRHYLPCCLPGFFRGFVSTALTILHPPNFTARNVCPPTMTCSVSFPITNWWTLFISIRSIRDSATEYMKMQQFQYFFCIKMFGWKACIQFLPLHKYALVGVSLPHNIIGTNTYEKTRKENSVCGCDKMAK